LVFLVCLVDTGLNRNRIELKRGFSPHAATQSGPWTGFQQWNANSDILHIDKTACGRSFRRSAHITRYSEIGLDLDAAKDHARETAFREIRNEKSCDR